MNIDDARKLRRCILRSIPEQLYYAQVAPQFVYIPRSHSLALDPARSLVVGGRGTGKTFWLNMLTSREGAKLLLPIVADQKREGLQFEVSVGFSTETKADTVRPLDADTLQALFAAYPERVVWKAVVLARVAPETTSDFGTWSEVVRWVHENPERFATVLAQRDDELFRAKRRHLILFDAIDRSGVSWKEIVRAHRGLFGVLLDLWGMRAIRAKAFVRLDIKDDPEVLRFPDASKLETSALELRWERADLYGLLWQYLGNSEESPEVFRSLMPGRWRRDEFRWVFDHSMNLELTQQGLWHRLAGHWMGANERRGDTYPWLPNHLADAFGRVSPRSFLAAVRGAARETPDNEAMPLLPRAIQEGVRSAAEIRAMEIREDFPWAQKALAALNDLNVPCEPGEVLATWANTDLALEVDRDDDARRRRRFGGPLGSVLDDLVDLGVMQRLRDDRINVPDVYRLRYGIKRRGGVPAQRG